MAIALTSTRPALRFAGIALLGSWLLAASAQISLPMWPVPATLQTLAVLLLGALGGPAATSRGSACCVSRMRHRSQASA